MNIPHTFEFDPTYGCDDAALLAVRGPAGPDDFADFWRATFEEAMAPPLNLSVTPTRSPRESVEVFHVEYDSLGGVRIGGWMTRPTGGGPLQRGVVVGHGYGGRDAPDLGLPGLDDAATIQFCARGFNRSRHPDLPNVAARHVTHGIEHRDTYIHRGCVADAWRAASALLECWPQVADELYYHGGSFGGGIGALALPWDARFRKAFLRVPSFGHHPLRVTLPCTGSGHFVTRYWQQHPHVLADTLAYHDAATAARHITIPVLVCLARFDPAVPPPGQAAVYNALPGPRELVWRDADHYAAYPGEADDLARVHAAVARWFAAPNPSRAA